MDRPLGPLIRLAAALTLVALGLVPDAAVPAAADPADPATPTLSPGSHPVTLPSDGPETFRVRRTAPGSTLHVALWYVGTGDSVGEGVRLTIGTARGDTGCGSGAVFRPTLGEPAPLLTTTASTWTDEPEHPCGTAAQLHVTVGVPSDRADRGRAATLLVYEEPPLSSYAFELLREPAPPPWVALAPAPAAPSLTPGTTPGDAPVVGPGSRTLALRPGRTAVVAVPVGWDQSLRAQVDGSADATLAVLGPLLGQDLAATEPGRVQSHVASYLHRDSFDPTRAGAALAGVRYLLVGLPPEAPAVRVTLTVAVDGTPGEGVPDYATTGGVPAPRGDSRLVDGSLAPPVPPALSLEAGAQDDRSAGRWLGAGALSAAVLGAAVLVLRGRRKRPTRRGARVRGR